MSDLIIKAPGVYKADGKVYRTVLILCDGVTLDGVRVKFTPDASTVSYTPAVKAVGRSGLRFLNMKVTGGAAVKGVSKRAKPDADRPGNAVLGLPIGRAFGLDHCTDVIIQDTEIATFFEGIVLSGGSDISILGNNIHGLRTTAIHGTPTGNVKVVGNHLHDANPWQLGKADHADFIHFWTNPDRSTEPVANVEITGNLIEQGAGQPIMGINLEDRTGIGFTSALIARNTIRLNNGQGIRAGNMTGDIIGNTLEPVPGLDDPTNAPSIVPRNCHVAITGNTCRMNTAMKPYAARNVALSPAQIAKYGALA